MSETLIMKLKDPEQITDVTVISQHLVNTIDYICGSLPNPLEHMITQC